MPLVRIDVRKGKSPEYRRDLGDAVYHAMVEAIGAPEGDQFEIIAEHDESGLIYNPNYQGIDRSDDVVFVQIFLNEGRSVEQKKALYGKIVELLEQKPGVRREDVVINLVEVSKADWSWGSGVAQYVT